MSRPPSRVTALQEALITLHLLVEDSRDGLSAEQFSAFVWIGADIFGLEAAKVVVAEALDATEESAA